GLIPFIADPTVGAGIAAKAPTFSVNRQFKGDRLPVSQAPGGTRRGLSTQEQSAKPAKIPVGCEGSCSPISSPRLAHILGGCMTLSKLWICLAGAGDRALTLRFAESFGIGGDFRQIKLECDR